MGAAQDLHASPEREAHDLAHAWRRGAGRQRTLHRGVQLVQGFMQGGVDPSPKRDAQAHASDVFQPWTGCQGLVARIDLAGVAGVKRGVSTAPLAPLSS